jgi:hypothetical protein
LHQRHELGPILNARWISSDAESHWIQQLHGVWSIQVSYKLWVFAWLVIYQGLPSKARLAKSGLFDGLCPSCLKSESVKHILWECSFVRSCWAQVQSQLENILQGHLHWWEILFGDSRSVIQDSLAGIWHCLRVSALYILWKLHCKFVFDNEVSSQSTFLSIMAR